MSHPYPSHSGSVVYKPTSLDFINRPNPVEPQSEPHRHPLNGFTQVPQPSYEEYVWNLIDRHRLAGPSRPYKRRKSGNGKSLDLPRLPVRPGAKRQRLPPTLSGLHQPPPDAGILPSISTDQPLTSAQQKPLELSRPLKSSDDQSEVEQSSSATDKQAAPKQPATAKPKRRKWSDEETADLLKGVARFGIGAWTKILKHEGYSFQGRSALDLKDRFRVCCPDDYKRKKLAQGPSKKNGATASSRSERKTREELKELGINQPFTKSDRRKRTDYSAEEDEALLRGFRKYRNGWAEIRSDEGLGLDHRTPTDLRDRMRNKFPEEFATLGLAPRAGDSAKAKSKGDRVNNDRATITTGSNTDKTNVRPLRNAVEKPLSLASIVAPVDAALLPLPPPSKPTKPVKQSQKLFPPFHDPYFGATFDQDDSDTEPITLDRDILDWPSDFSKHYSDSSKGAGGIDPLATLNLPKPTAVPHSTASQAPTIGAGTLPSVAAITAGGSFEYGDDDGLQLPSLMFGPMYEGDAMRTSGPGHFLGIDELIS